MIRQARTTYAVCVTRPFVRGRDSLRKLVRRDGAEWCQDALDVLVYAGQQICLGDTVVRRYSPAALSSSSRAVRSLSPTESSSSRAVFDVYRSDSREVRYTTDSGVVRVASLALDLDEAEDVDRSGTTSSTSTSVVELRASFGGEELRLCAVDTVTGRAARTTVPFACQ